MRIFVLALLMVCSGYSDIWFAPFYEEKKDEKKGFTRTVGPIYESVKMKYHTRKAIRPIWSVEEIPGKKAMDFIWPFSAYRKSQDYHRSYFLTIFYSNKKISDPESARYFYIMPFWFQGKSVKGEKFKGLFPVWGSVHDFISYDKIKFRVFPIYSEAHKKDMVSKSWLWPFITHANSPKETKRRYFPFYSKVVRKGSHETGFVLWPFYHHGKSVREGNKGSWYLLWPFYGRINYEKIQSRTVLWPFYMKRTTPNEELLHAPWPFYQKRKSLKGGVLKTKLSYWPFYEIYKTPESEKKHYLWPFITKFKSEVKNRKIVRNYYLPFYWNYQESFHGVEKRNYKRVWPLYSYEKTPEMSNFRFLALWPGNSHPTVERNWSPIWTLYSKYKKGENYRTDVLWGAYQKYQVDDKKGISVFPLWDKHSDKQDKSWKVLKGLIGREVKDGKKKWRLLWFIKF